MGQMNVMRLRSCTTLLQTACQKFESCVVPGTESPCFQAMAAGMTESKDTVGTINVNVDRVLLPSE